MGKYWVTTSDGRRHQTAAGYKRSYDLYHKSATAKTERASRNSARRSALRSGLAHKGDNTDVHHVDSTPTNNRKSNLRVIARSTNRAKHEGSRKRGSKRSRYGD